MVSELDGVSEVGILSLSFSCASNIFNFKIPFSVSHSDSGLLDYKAFFFFFGLFLGVHDV